jgi:capsular exopolysaccharide synthesis family protein
VNGQAELEQGGAGLRHQLGVVRRRIWIVVPIPIVAAVLAFVVASVQPNEYQATTKIVVGQGKGLFQPGVAYAVQPFTATMGNLVKSNIVAEQIIGNLGLQETPQTILHRISVVVDPTTAVIQVSVTDRSKARATEIAAQLGRVFSKLVKARFGGSQTVAGPNGALAQLPLTATIFDPAHAAPGPVSPRPLRDAVIALALGLVLGLLAAFLREHFDRKLRTRDDVERAFGVPVIGQVPWIRPRRNGETAVWSTSGGASEAVRALRANLQYLSVGRPLRTILVTSASPGQGKTTMTANLAIAIARSGATTVALEGDLRRPALAQALGRSRTGAGLTGVLVGAADVDDAVIDIPVRDESTAAEAGIVSLLPSGPLPPNPSELLASQEMRETLQHLSSLYDHVLVDSPPLLLVADALELARIVDGVVIVARRNRATTEEAKEVRALVERLGITLLGVIVTDVEPTGGYYHAYEATQPIEQIPMALAPSNEP